MILRFISFVFRRTDDDFREFVDQIPEGCRITIVSDSCHSGGLIDEAKEQIGESTKRGKDDDDDGEEKSGGSSFGFSLRDFLGGKVQMPVSEPTSPQIRCCQEIAPRPPKFQPNITFLGNYRCTVLM